MRVGIYYQMIINLIKMNQIRILLIHLTPNISFRLGKLTYDIRKSKGDLDHHTLMNNTQEIENI